MRPRWNASASRGQATIASAISNTRLTLPSASTIQKPTRGETVPAGTNTGLGVGFGESLIAVLSSPTSRSLTPRDLRRLYARGVRKLSIRITRVLRPAAR
jgi:hypothetical protein